MKSRILAVSIVAVFFFFAGAAQAYQPRIVEEGEVKIENPEISQVFYGELKGSAQIFKIEKSEPFQLYMGLLVPNASGAKKNYSLSLSSKIDLPDLEGNVMPRDSVFAYLNGKDYQWTEYYDLVVGDKYFKGPEYKANNEGEKLQGVDLEPGEYTVMVYSEDNLGKYALVVGTKEDLSPAAISNTIKTLPQVKKDYFEKSPFSIFFGFAGLIPLVLLAALIIVARKMRNGKKMKMKEAEDALD